MRRLLTLLTVACASILLYILTFVFVLDKPITIGALGGILELKQRSLENMASPGIVVFAGSNGHFSHRCETISEETGRDCANMSVSVELSAGYQLWRLRKALKRNDMLYLPLEYAFYQSSVTERIGRDIPYYLWHDQEYLLDRSWLQRAHALFYFDLPFIFSAIAEMAANSLALGVASSRGNFNTRGDHVDHANAATRPIPMRDFSNYRFNIEALRDSGLDGFLDWCKSIGIVVIGGLPTTPLEASVPASLTENIRDYYLQKGHKFLLLDNQSRYPENLFYDSDYHLIEALQIAHSRRVGKALMPLTENR